ncbi:uncharacterized protein DS421_12g365340 [Arachis hypogaea]|nr:uncharacterized protein DS421_12g365340 [Arachis hypogaea]
MQQLKTQAAAAEDFNGRERQFPPLSSIVNHDGGGSWQWRRWFRRRRLFSVRASSGGGKDGFRGRDLTKLAATGSNDDGELKSDGGSSLASSHSPSSRSPTSRSSIVGDDSSHGRRGPLTATHLPLLRVTHLAGVAPSLFSDSPSPVPSDSSTSLSVLSHECR